MEHLIAFVLGIFIGAIATKAFTKVKVVKDTTSQPAGNNPATEDDIKEPVKTL